MAIIVKPIINHTHDKKNHNIHLEICTKTISRLHSSRLYSSRRFAAQEYVFVITSPSATNCHNK